MDSGEFKENGLELLLWGEKRGLELNGKLSDSIRSLRLEFWDCGSHQVDCVTLVIFVGLGIGTE